MKIQKKKENILITTEGIKTFIAFESKNIDNDLDIIINLTKEAIKDDKAFIISSPGEYEDKNVMVQAIPAVNSKEIEVLSIDNEGINLIIVDSNTKAISKKELEQIGINNILIFKETEGLGNIFELVDDLSPGYFIPICKTKESLEQITKRLAVNVGETQKNFSITQDDLPIEGEEQILQLIILE